MQRLGGLLVTAFLAFALPGFAPVQDLYYTETGEVNFTSDAPLEVIKAASDKLAGILNTGDRSFSFSIPMKSFQGFNSSLQRTHFNENYLESDLYAQSTFNGKIIEEVDFSSPGVLKVRAKGKLNIHGIEQDRIIRCSMKISPGSIEVETEFKVPLEDHDITIPSIVQQKIAEIIDVSIRFTLKK